MTEIPSLTDKQKIDKWNEVCIDAKWAQKGELEKWLSIHGVQFTKGGSSFGEMISTTKVEDLATVEALAIASNGEAMATFVLQVLTGILFFPSTELEATFWRNIINRLSSEWHISTPAELIPKYIRAMLKYPKDDYESPRSEEPPAEPNLQ